MLLDLNPDVISTPEEAELISQALQQLTGYVQLRGMACTARLEGRIADALSLEQSMDELYAKLPESVRWCRDPL